MPRPSHPSCSKRILIVLHQETSTPGRVGLMLTRRGYTLDMRRPRFGDPLPETMDDHAGAIVFGGPMSANDPDDYIRAEIDWLDVPLKAGAPLLGICLGAQMMVRQFGGTVKEHPDGHVEVGYYPIHATPTGEGLMHWPHYVYQWHREGFDLPTGLDLLATGHIFPNQAFRAGPAAFGIQFHPELTTQMVHRWTVKGAHRLDSPGAKPRDSHFHDRLVHDGTVRAWLDQFLDRWLKGADGWAPPCQARAALPARLTA